MLSWRCCLSPPCLATFTLAPSAWKALSRRWAKAPSMSIGRGNITGCGWRMNWPERVRTSPGASQWQPPPNNAVKQASKRPAFAAVAVHCFCWGIRAHVAFVSRLGYAYGSFQLLHVFTISLRVLEQMPIEVESQCDIGVPHDGLNTLWGPFEIRDEQACRRMS